MIQKYAILDPSTGSYTYTESIEESYKILAEKAMSFYFNHTHENPISYITIDENNNEIWKNANNEIILSPSEILNELEKISKINKKITPFTVERI